MRHYFIERKCICGQQIIGRAGCTDVPCTCGESHDFDDELSLAQVAAAKIGENNRRMVIPAGDSWRRLVDKETRFPGWTKRLG